MTLQVRPLLSTDAEKLRWHLNRAGQESGRDGDVVFSPVTEPREEPLEDFAKEFFVDSKKALTDAGWERVWVITDENKIYGELRLVHRPPIKSCLHRATLMMGIEREARAQGFGSKLMDAALAWAKDQPTLDWIDLNVFEHNQPARKLYAKYGFKESGVTRDMFRVNGQSIDDISMNLYLR